MGADVKAYDDQQFRKGYFPRISGGRALLFQYVFEIAKVDFGSKFRFQLDQVERERISKREYICRLQ